ncbi:MAG TPA: hypothetical protein VEB65_10910 [Solirubrobacterales bacterium]|nr:hypothetical protein [Solirubrobacterales bacterium]
MKRLRSLTVALLATAFLVLLAAATAVAAATPKEAVEPSGVLGHKLDEPEEAAAKQLAKKYVPIVMLREQEKPPCETSAEQYQPTSVETMLGNPTVTLQKYDETSQKLEDVKKGPTIAEVSGLKGDYFLNLRGEALGDTCVYARDFEQLLLEEKAPPVTYAHIAREPNHEGFALQYWFFWYFNQFNDLHEGDWEGMQLTFESNTPKQALKEEPGEMILFQHAGGEKAKWDDSKVQKDGTHPVVYPAAGSHATFYDSAVYVQNGQNGSGVGCDNTTAPLRELQLRPVTIPEAAPENGPFGWMSYRGRWGEREKGYNNGPTGPVTKTVWREPFAWMADQRSTSPRLPGGSIVGPQVTGAFCGAVAAASELINLDIQSPGAATVTIVIAVLVLALLIGVTKWWPVDLEHLRKKRAFGQLVRAARQLYGRHFLVLVPIGLTALPIVGAITLLGQTLANRNSGDNGGVRLALADFLEFFGRPAASALVAALVIVFLRGLVETGRGGYLDSWRGVGQRFWRVVGAQIMATLGVALLALTVIGIPWAIWKYFCWQFVQQQILFEDKPLRAAFRDSSELVRGSWWRTVRVAGFFWLLSTVAGPVLGFALIFLNFELVWINLIGSLVFALIIPYVTLGHTLLYFDLQERAATDRVRPRRSWRIWRPRQFGRVVRPGTAAAA